MGRAAIGLLGMLMFVVSGSTPAVAARRVHAAEPLMLRLEMGFMSLVVFPEPIKEVYAYVDPKQYSVEHGGERLAIQPLVPELRGRLFVIGASNAHYQVSYGVASPADDVVYVLSAQQKPQVAAVLKALAMPDVMRALREGRALPGQETVTLPVPSLPDARLTVVGTQAMKIKQYVGLVLSIRNATEQGLGLDIRYGHHAPSAEEARVHLSALALPPGHTVLGISADKDTLGPGDTMQLYLVLERRGPS